MKRPRRTRQLRGWVGGVALALGIASCGAPNDAIHPSTANTTTPGAPAEDAPSRIVRISQGSDLLSLDPHAHFESPTFAIQRNLFDPLTDLDADARLVPCLAESWRHEDATHWIFTLRRGVTFHEGQPFTAEDAVFSLRRAREWARSKVKSEIATICGVEAIDEYTIRIETRVGDAILPTRLAQILMMDRESTERKIEEGGDAALAVWANGTGAYRVERWRKDASCRLRAHEGFWGGASEVRRLDFIPTANDATRLTALRRGEVDLMVNVPPRAARQAEQPGCHLVARPSLRLIYLGLDCGRDETPGVTDSPPNPMCDARVRRAMALAIDNRLIVETIMGGHARAADQLLPEGVTGYDPSIHLKRPDLETARRLLAEAGWPDGFPVRLDGPNDRYVNDAAIMQAVGAQLARVGIEVHVNAQPKARFFSDESQGRCSFFLLGWANTNGDGAATFEHLLHTPDAARGLGAANASTCYSNARLDDLSDRAAGEFDPEARRALLREAHRTAMDDGVHIPLHFQSDLYAVSTQLEWSPRRDTQVRGVDLRWAE